MKSNQGNELGAIRPNGHAAHKHRLKDRGWSNRKACIFLGISLSQLSHVLNGHRPSKRTLDRVWNIPQREEVQS